MQSGGYFHRRSVGVTNPEREETPGLNLTEDIQNHSPTTNTQQTEWPPTDDGIRERLRDLPPSATLVALVLSTHGPIAAKDIVDRTLLPPRTVRYGLKTLEEAELLATRPCLRDTRAQVYYLQP